MTSDNKLIKIDIMGVKINTLRISESVEHIVSLASRGEGAYYVVKPYVEFFDKLHTNRDFVSQLNTAELCLPDGIAIKWAAHFKKHTKHRFIDVVRTGFDIVFRPENIATVLKDHFGGSKFTWPLLVACAENNLNVFLVGSPLASDITYTASYLEKHIPGLNVIGTQSGRAPITDRYNSAMARQLKRTLKKTSPDIVLFGLNFETYVPLMQQLAKDLKHGVLIGEGGTFDYDVFGGTQPKAPQRWQKNGLEWLWRLIRQPRRFRRQLAIPRFIWRVYRTYRA